MMKFFTLFFFFAIILSSCSCASINAAYLKNEKRSSQVESRSETAPAPPNDEPVETPMETFFYNQTIDHFNKKSEKFLQRFYINSTFYAEGGPIFLHTPGEGPITRETMTNSFVSQLAANFGGLLISIEHRYYGQSYPLFDNYTTKSLKFLTIDQALHDFANFIKNPPDELVKVPKTSRWITVGGSYAGNLAAWMRQKFPNLVFAAYSSSAPLEARIDFFQFDQKVTEALPCAKNISDAFRFVYDPILMSKNETAILELKSQFGLEMIKDNLDFASALSHPTSAIVQSYSPSPSDQPDKLSIICLPFAQSQSPEASALIYAEGFKLFLNATDILTPDDKRKKFSTTSIISLTEKNDLTPYTYQYCNELGYYQTFPKSSSISTRSETITVDYYQGQCDFLFPGITSSPKVKKTNKKFGGFNGKFSRTVFVNGGMDPWTPLTVSGDAANPKVENNTIFLVEGGSHVMDLRSPTDIDSDSLKQSRLFVINNLSNWLTTI